MFRPGQLLKFSRSYASKVVSKSKIAAAAKGATSEKHMDHSSSKRSTDDIFNVSKPLENRKIEFANPLTRKAASHSSSSFAADSASSSSSSSSSSSNSNLTSTTSSSLSSHDKPSYSGKSSKTSSSWYYYILMFGAGSICAFYFPPISILQQYLNKDLPSSAKLNSSTALSGTKQTIADFADDQEVQNYIKNLRTEMQSLPIVTKLTANPEYICHRGWSDPESSILQTSLSLPGGFTVPPLFFENSTTGDSVTVLHVGSKLCGYPFIIHGGILATILDECFKRTVLTSLENRKRADKQNHDELQSVDLKLKYSNPTIANNFVVVQCNIMDKLKCGYSVKGTIETPDGKLLVTGISDLQIGSCIAESNGITHRLHDWISSFWKGF